MNQLSLGPNKGADPHGTAPEAGAGSGPAAAAAPAPAGQAGVPAKYDAVLGPFTVRDLSVFVSTLILFVASLLPMLGGRYNLWNVNNLFFLGIGIILPLIVAALFVARRLQPDAVVRIGSLSVDQFASVTASFAVAFFFLATASSFTGSALLGLLGALGLLLSTVLAPRLPWLREDFKGRAETPAHVVARDAAVPSRKPAAPKAPKTPKKSRPAAWNPLGRAGAPAVQPPATSAQGAAAPTGQATQAAAVVPPAPVPPVAVQPAAGPAAPAVEQPAAEQSTAPQPSAPQPAAAAHGAAAQQPLAATMATPVVSADTRKVSESIGATVDPASRPEESAQAPAYEAFWFAVAQPRPAVSEQTGEPVFTIEPGGWVLALEDRGHEFLVQDTDGKVGVLRDLSHIERG